jgi:hypothetical protein
VRVRVNVVPEALDRAEVLDEALELSVREQVAIRWCLTSRDETGAGPEQVKHDPTTPAGSRPIGFLRCYPG